MNSQDSFELSTKWDIAVIWIRLTKFNQNCPRTQTGAYCHYWYYMYSDREPVLCKYTGVYMHQCTLAVECITVVLLGMGVSSGWFLHRIAISIIHATLFFVREIQTIMQTSTSPRFVFGLYFPYKTNAGMYYIHSKGTVPLYVFGGFVSTIRQICGYTGTWKLKGWVSIRTLLIRQTIMPTYIHIFTECYKLGFSYKSFECCFRNISDMVAWFPQVILGRTSRKAWYLLLASVATVILNTLRISSKEL